MLRPRLAAALALPLLLPACMTLRDGRHGLRPFGGTRAYFVDHEALLPDAWHDAGVIFTLSMCLLPVAGPVILGGVWVTLGLADRVASLGLDLVLLPVALIPRGGRDPDADARVAVIGSGSSFAEVDSLTFGAPTSASVATEPSSVAPVASIVPIWDRPPPPVRPAGSTPEPAPDEAPRVRGVRPAR